MSIGERLKEALDLREMSNRKFIEAMSARGVPGSSEPAVYRYLRGESEPSLAFITAAAEELEVFPMWLAFGTGPRDQTAAVLEQFEEAMARMAQAGIGHKGDLDAMLREVFPLYRRLGADAQYAIGYTTLRLTRVLDIHHPDADEDQRMEILRHRMKEVGEFALSMIRFVHPNGVPDSNLRDFLTGLALALRSLMPEAASRGIFSLESLSVRPERGLD